MIKIYGSLLCPDCVQCKEDLDKAGIASEPEGISSHSGKQPAV